MMVGGGRDGRPAARARSPGIMTAPDLVNLSALIDDAKCFALVRQQRWPEGVRCPARLRRWRRGPGWLRRHPAAAAALPLQGLRGALRRPHGHGAGRPGHRQPLRIWVLCLYLMGLNLSNRQIAQELGLDGSDAQARTEQLRRGLVAKAPPVRLEGEVEIDEVYVVAGHKGQPAAVAKRGARDAAAGWRERRAAARWRRVRRTAP